MPICPDGSLREAFPQHPCVRQAALATAGAGVMPSEDLTAASGTYLDFKNAALGEH